MDNDVKRYKFNLDLPPKERWTHILDDYKDKLPKLKATIDAIMNMVSVKGLVYSSLNFLISCYKNQIMFYDELSSISQATGIEFGKLLLMQLIYEASSACTCLVTRVNNEYVMYRTMDWAMPFLKDITIELEIIKGGKTLAISPTWVGCVGMFTIHIPNKYSIAINYRRTKPIGFTSLLQNIYRTLSMSWPISYLVRRIAESNIEYEEAVKLLQEATIISPCYITVYSFSKSCIITRSIDSQETHSINVDPNNNINNDKLFLVQTNRDNVDKLSNPVALDDILYSTKRYELASELIKIMNNNWPSLEELFTKMSIQPIINDETIYACIISKDKIITKI
jgi:hypothetical protein